MAFNPKIADPALEAARDGRSFCGFVNGKTGIASSTVLTDSGFLLQMVAGRRYFITCFYMYLSTTSDWVTVEWGVTPHNSGGGAFTAKTVKFRIDTGNVQSGQMPSLTRMSPPMTFTTDDGGAFTARVQGNDANAALTVGYNGFYEELP